MRHDHQAARPFEQRLLQPFHGVQVEVIGRLIEQEQVGLFQEKASEQGAGALAAAERRQRLGVLLRAEAQAGQHLLRAQLVGVTAANIERELQLAVAGEQPIVLFPVLCCGQCALQRGQLRLLGAQFVENLEDIVPQR